MQLILFHLFYITRNCFLFSLKYQREPPSDDEVPFSSIIFSNNQIKKSTQKPFIQKGPRCPPQSFLGQKNRHTRGRTSSRNKRGPTTGWLSRYRGRTKKKKKKKKKKRGYINKQRVYRFVHAKGEGMTLRRIGESDRMANGLVEEERAKQNGSNKQRTQRVVGFNEDESNFSGFLARAGRCACSCAAIGWNSVGKVRGRVTADRIISICWNL